MDKLLQQLIRDHRQIEKVINEVEQEVILYQPDSMRIPNLSLILAGLDYIKNYPEAFHHPLEDRLIEQLQQKDIDAELRHCLKGLQHQHQFLEKQTTLLVREFTAAANDQRINVNLLATGCGFNRHRVDPQSARGASNPIVQHNRYAQFASLFQQGVIDLCPSIDNCRDLDTGAF